MTVRDYNREHRDGATKYAYDFDAIVRRYMMKALSPHFRPGRALELGCYTGDVTEMIAEVYPDLTVVEASSELVSVASRRLGDRARFVTGTFESVALDGRYDAIFLVHTLEHIDDPVFVLRRIAGWLTESGRLFVVVPNAHAASRQIAVKMGLIASPDAVTDGEREHGHRRTYSLDTLERDVHAAGLPVVDRGGVFFKALANYQFDRLIGGDVISEAYLDGCYELGAQYPDLCASIYVVCEAGPRAR
jgi:2-polyprenyl-3-methyl-5-hydroxy-6-metoxy-1,4-benzoquinol methylase